MADPKLSSPEGEGRASPKSCRVDGPAGVVGLQLALKLFPPFALKRSQPRALRHLPGCHTKLRNQARA
jgi:hypothetical protein